MKGYRKAKKGETKCEVCTKSDRRNKAHHGPRRAPIYCTVWFQPWEGWERVGRKMTCDRAPEFNK